MMDAIFDLLLFLLIVVLTIAFVVLWLVNKMVKEDSQQYLDSE